MGGRKVRAASCPRRGADRPEGGCHRCRWYAGGRCGEEGDVINSSGHGRCWRPCRHWSRREPCSARRKPHRIGVDCTGLEGKRLELLREVVPKLSTVSFLMNTVNAFHVISQKQAREAAALLRLTVQFVDVRADSEFDRAFAAIIKERPGALIMLADRLFLHHRGRIVDFAARHRLPGMYAYRELVDAGGLMSFGPSYPKCTGAPPTSWTGFSKVRSPPTYRWSNPPSSSWSST